MRVGDVLGFLEVEVDLRGVRIARCSLLASLERRPEIREQDERKCSLHTRLHPAEVEDDDLVLVDDLAKVETRVVALGNMVEQRCESGVGGDSLHTGDGPAHDLRKDIPVAFEQAGEVRLEGGFRDRRR